MDEKRPKRRKAKDNPYTLAKIEDSTFFPFETDKGYYGKSR